MLEFIFNEGFHSSRSDEVIFLGEILNHIDRGSAGLDFTESEIEGILSFHLKNLTRLGILAEDIDHDKTHSYKLTEFGAQFLREVLGKAEK